MNHATLRHIALAVATLAALALATLWSWNTLASLANLPSAGFRHAIAAVLLLWVARLLLTRPRGCRGHVWRRGKTS